MSLKPPKPGKKNEGSCLIDLVLAGHCARGSRMLGPSCLHLTTVAAPLEAWPALLQRSFDKMKQGRLLNN
eukprot:6128519-Amphidinium_carterae.1